MKIFVICPVRNADETITKFLKSYTKRLEKEGHKVHLPHRDTNQKASGLEICIQNCNAIKDADEVHIFYSSGSQGTHFDMGMAFALSKKIHIFGSESFSLKEKSFARMLNEWAAAQN